MTTTLLTENEIKNLNRELEDLQKIVSFTSEYQRDLSPSEYREIKGKIAQIEQKLKNATVIPTITLGKKFKARVDDSRILTLMISALPLELEDCVVCTCNSNVGKALLGTKLEDCVLVETSDGVHKYEVLSLL